MERIEVAMKHTEYVVLLREENGHTEVVRCSNFNTAVKMYRRLTSLYGIYSCQIFMEVVGYGEKV